MVIRRAFALIEFLSTLPARGATRLFAGLLPFFMYFYPRSPRGERHELLELLESCKAISIHAPREGSDPTPPPAR